MARKIAELRILDGEVSVADAGAPVLVVSQFTLYGRTAKGRRPSWADAAPGEEAEPVIEYIIERLRERNIAVESGQFGAMMRVSSVNEGPFTVWSRPNFLSCIFSSSGVYLREHPLTPRIIYELDRTMGNFVQQCISLGVAQAFSE